MSQESILSNLEHLAEPLLTNLILTMWSIFQALCHNKA